MPSEIKLWRIEDDKPKHVDQDTLDLESRPEGWIRQDIGLVSDDLLVIGQQAKTAYGGVIDLLAVDSDANPVILELKRDKTSREVVAQALDYASWVQGLDYEGIENLASNFFAESNGSLEEAFREKFESGLLEVVNQRHRIYIVASSLDSSTERIVEYLSETHGVDINVATFAYFKTGKTELVGRSMLLDEETIETRAESRRTSKNKPLPSEDDFRGIAEGNGVVDLWDRAMEELKPLCERYWRNQGDLYFQARVDGRLRTFLWMIPGDSSPDDGLAIRVQHDYISSYFDISKDQVVKVWESEQDTRSFTADHLDSLINLLKQSVP